MRLTYRADADTVTERTVWPVLLGYAESYSMLIAWCELRADFRHFRTDRIVSATPLDAAFDETPAALRRRWEAWRRARVEDPTVRG